MHATIMPVRLKNVSQISQTRYLLSFDNVGQLHARNNNDSEVKNVRQICQIKVYIKFAQNCPEWLNTYYPANVASPRGRPTIFARARISPVLLSQKPMTHLAILFADRGEFDLQRKSQAIFTTESCGHTWRFFSPIAAMWHLNLVPRFPFEKACDKIAQPDWLTLLAMSVENRGNGHTRRMPANLIADI